MKCDELKDRWFWAYPTESVDCDGITGSAHEVYSKSDVDAAIDELKTAHHKERHEYIKMIAELQKQVYDYKFKHCLNMAYKCAVLCNKSKDLYRWAEDENLEHHYNHKIEFFARWHNRWQEIAEKFKEYK